MKAAKLAKSLRIAQGKKADGSSNCPEGRRALKTFGPILKFLERGQREEKVKEGSGSTKVNVPKIGRKRGESKALRAVSK